jgi:hypothetical protein
MVVKSTTNHIDNIRFPVKKEKRGREVISMLLLRGWWAWFMAFCNFFHFAYRDSFLKFVILFQPHAPKCYKHQSIINTWEGVPTNQVKKKPCKIQRNKNLSMSGIMIVLRWTKIFCTISFVTKTSVHEYLAFFIWM